MNDTKPKHDRTAQAGKAQTKAERAEPERKAGAEQLQTENARLKEELRREHEIYLRNLADFENYRRRVERGGILILTPEAVITKERVAEGDDTAR